MEKMGRHNRGKRGKRGDGNGKSAMDDESENEDDRSYTESNREINSDDESDSDSDYQQNKKKFTRARHGHARNNRRASKIDPNRGDAVAKKTELNTNRNPLLLALGRRLSNLVTKANGLVAVDRVRLSLDAEISETTTLLEETNQLQSEYHVALGNVRGGESAACKRSRLNRQKLPNVQLLVNFLTERLNGLMDKQQIQISVSVAENKVVQNGESMVTESNENIMDATAADTTFESTLFYPPNEESANSNETGLFIRINDKLERLRKAMTVKELLEITDFTKADQSNGNGSFVYLTVNKEMLPVLDETGTPICINKLRDLLRTEQNLNDDQCMSRLPATDVCSRRSIPMTENDAVAVQFK